MTDAQTESIHRELETFAVELPSWGFADTGTRFGKFLQDGAAIDTNDKFQDAGEVHRLTGACPTVAVHVLWDFQEGEDPKQVAKLAQKHGVKIGAINPNVFQDQAYKYGSFGAREPEVRAQAAKHVADSIEIGKQVQSKYLSLWFADGTNYPGQDCVRRRKKCFEEELKRAHELMSPEQVMLVEYKPFEPAFYFTDIADWGMAYLHAKKAGPQAKVLVDTGHHYQSQNIEQIVAWLLEEEMLGGFHFNDRKYADDDLTLSSIDPYHAFRVFYEIQSYAAEYGKMPEIAYMIDQSHNLKPKVEAMVQTVMMAQELYAKAAIVDWEVVINASSSNDVVRAEMAVREAFFADVTPTLRSWRESKGLHPDPLQALRESGYIAARSQERSARRKELGILAGGGYA